jgi:hypothetical protein
MVMIGTGKAKYWQEMSPISTLNHKFNMQSPATEDRPLP